MKRIFLDTNILIDYIDNRAGADNAEQIFACGFSMNRRDGYLFRAITISGS